MEYQLIRVEVMDEVAKIEMDRKHEMNALSHHMLREIDHAFNYFLKDESNVRLVVFTGGDECFSAGMDLKEIPNLSNDYIVKYFMLASKLYTTLMEYEKILISAVSGIAFGGGFNLALMGDIIIASESAIFGHPEIKYGFNPLLTPLVARVGAAKSKELALRAEPIGAREACQIGLVNCVVAPEYFQDEISSWASKLSARPPEVVRALKRAFDVVSRLDAKAAIEYEMEMMAMLFNTGDDTRMRMQEFITQRGHERDQTPD